MSLPPFHRLVEELGPALGRHVTALVGPTEADDLVQEVLLSALRAYPSLAADADLRAWLWTIARHKAIDGYRHRARRPHTVPLAEHRATMGLIEDGPGRRPDPVGATLPAEDPPDDDLWAEVRALPPGQRLAVTLRFVDDLAYDRIGELCGCSPGAARQRVYEGLQALRKALHQEVVP